MRIIYTTQHYSLRMVLWPDRTKKGRHNEIGCVVIIKRPELITCRVHQRGPFGKTIDRIPTPYGIGITNEQGVAIIVGVSTSGRFSFHLLLGSPCMLHIQKNPAFL